MSASAILPSKRFKGAPFGIQTSRFDVSGVHPKSKTAGGYTEIPYDRIYIDELSESFCGRSLGNESMKNCTLNDCSKVSKQNISLIENKTLCALDCKVKKQKLETLKNYSEPAVNNKRTSMPISRSALATWHSHNTLYLGETSIKDSVVERQIKVLRKNPCAFQNARNTLTKRIFLKETNDVLNINTLEISKLNCMEQRNSHKINQYNHMNGGLETSLKVSKLNNNCSKATASQNQNANSIPNNSDSPKLNPETSTETVDSTASKESSDPSDRASTLYTADESNSIIYEEESNTSVPIIEIERDTAVPLKSALSKTKKIEDTTKRVSFESKLKTILTEEHKTSMTASGSSKRSSVDENVLAETEYRRSINIAALPRKMSLLDKENVEVDKDILARVSFLMRSARPPEAGRIITSKVDDVICSTDQSKPDISAFARVYIDDLITELASLFPEVVDTLSGSPAVLDEPQSYDSGKLSYSEEHHTDTDTPVGSFHKAMSEDSALLQQKDSDSTSERNEDDIKLLQDIEQSLQEDHDDPEIPIGVPPNSVMEFGDIKAQVKKKKIEKLMQVPYESCDTFLKRKLGPGVYNLMIATEEERNTFEHAPKTGWARQLELERLASLPHLLYKEQWEEKKMLQKKLGPGSYNIKDFIEINNAKPRSGRGICDNLAPRFENKLMSATPGPGTYGIDGIPQRAVEMKDKKSASSKGILDTGDRKRNLPSLGSHLGPGTYKHTSCTEQLLNKVTGLRGPYNLCSSDRDVAIATGHYATMKPANLGPGQYDVKSFVDELDNEHKRTQGRFAKVQQYPEFTYVDSPGPASYDIKHHNRKCSHGVHIPGFLSSAKRDDKISQKFFAGNHNPVGAGRYDIQKYDEAQSVNGCVSAFKSKTNRPNEKLSRFLQERLRPKDINPEDRANYTNPHRMTRSITIM